MINKTSDLARKLPWGGYLTLGGWMVRSSGRDLAGCACALPRKMKTSAGSVIVTHKAVSLSTSPWISCVMFTQSWCWVLEHDQGHQSGQTQEVFTKETWSSLFLSLLNYFVAAFGLPEVILLSLILSPAPKAAVSQWPKDQGSDCPLCSALGSHTSSAVLRFGHKKDIGACLKERNKAGEGRSCMTGGWSQVGVGLF